MAKLKNFIEQPINEATERWTGAFENYTLKSNGKTTTLIAEIDLTPEHIGFFNESFPMGLKKIKELSELNRKTEIRF